MEVSGAWEKLERGRTRPANEPGAGSGGVEGDDMVWWRSGVASRRRKRRATCRSAARARRTRRGQDDMVTDSLGSRRAGIGRVGRGEKKY